MYVSPQEAATYFGVSRETVRLWAEKDKIKYTKTKGGHRKYWIDNSNKTKVICKTKKPDTIIYARVSSSKQKEDLDRQVKTLENYCNNKKYHYEITKDIASGVNFNRKGLQKILELSMQGNIKRIVVAYKDRLARIGFELINWIFNKFGTVIEIMHSQSTGPESEIVEDIVAIITHYTAKIHGSRK